VPLSAGGADNIQEHELNHMGRWGRGPIRALPSIQLVNPVCRGLVRTTRKKSIAAIVIDPVFIAHHPYVCAGIEQPFP
jgi:hypothetical protein